MLFGLSLPVLILMTVGGVDIHRASTVRVNLQDALDAATLAAARSPYTEDEDLRQVGLAALRANLKAYPDIILREADTTFSLNDDAVVVASSKVDVKTLVANIFMPPYGKFMDDYLPVGAHSEVNRSSKNLEVALVLDITGSMSRQPHHRDEGRRPGPGGPGGSGRPDALLHPHVDGALFHRREHGLLGQRRARNA